MTTAINCSPDAADFLYPNSQLTPSLHACRWDKDRSLEATAYFPHRITAKQASRDAAASYTSDPAPQPITSHWVTSQPQQPSQHLLTSAPRQSALRPHLDASLADDARNGNQSTTGQDDHNQQCGLSSVTEKDIWSNTEQLPSWRTSVNERTKNVPLTLRISQISLGFLKLNEVRTKRAKLELEEFYVGKSSELESCRYSSLVAAAGNQCLTNSITAQYDEQHHALLDRVDKSIGLLEQLAASVPRLRTKASATPSSAPKVSELAIQIMKTWYDRHCEHPYPGYEAAEVMAKAGNLSVEQVKKWFANRRQRSGMTKAISEIARRRKRTRTPSNDDILFQSAKMTRLH